MPTWETSQLLIGGRLMQVIAIVLCCLLKLEDQILLRHNKSRNPAENDLEFSLRTVLMASKGATRGEENLVVLPCSKFYKLQQWLAGQDIFNDDTFILEVTL